MEGRGEGAEGGVEQPEGTADEGDQGEEQELGGSDAGTDEDEEELLKDEDAIQTAARLLNKKEGEDSKGEESSEEESVSGKEEESADESADSDSDDSGGVEEEEIEPPIRLPAEAKKAFKQWPKKAQQEFSSAVKNLESTFNRNNQELTNARKEVDHLMQAVRPYYTSKPELAAQGITEAQVITGLIGNHQLLTHDDESVRRQKYLAIGQSIRLVNEHGELITKDENGGGGQLSTSAINQVVKQAVQTEVSPIKSFVESQQQVQQNKATENVVADIKSVMDETDSAGNYLYPELHDTNYHGQQVKPLVAGLVRSIPNLSYGAATKMAVEHLRSQNGKSNSSNPTRLPTNNESHKERAAQAGVSVRSKSTVSSSGEKLSPLQERIMNSFPVGGN